MPTTIMQIDGVSWTDLVASLPEGSSGDQLLQVGGADLILYRADDPPDNVGDQLNKIGIRVSDTYWYFDTTEPVWATLADDGSGDSQSFVVSSV